MTMTVRGLLGNYVRLPKNWHQALERNKSLVAKTEEIAGRIKTSYMDPKTGDLVGTVTRAEDGRIITKIPINVGGTYFNTPAEEVIRLMGLEMHPKNAIQGNLQNRIFSTANCETLRLNKGCETEVIKPNGESSQYFYHRGVVAKGYDTFPEKVLESPYDVSGKLTLLEEKDSCYNRWLLEKPRITNRDTGLSKNLNGCKYIEFAVD